MSRKKLYKLAMELKLNKKHIEEIFNHINYQNEKLSITSGPPWYPGSKYGTISIKEFILRYKK